MTPNQDIPTLRNLDDILRRAQEINSEGEPYRVAVAAAHDEAVIGAVVAAHNEGIAESVLFGDAGRIRQMIEEAGNRPEEFRIIHAPDNDEAAAKVAASAGRGETSLILKGLLPTSKLLKNVLNEKYGLRRKGLLSHTAVLGPTRYPKLLAVTDGGMVIKPTFEQKVEIIRNAVLVVRALGIEIPKVAVLSSIDQILPSFPDTFEAAALSKMAQRGQIRSCEIDGPMSFDTAVWTPAVEYQGINSSVAGQADIVVASSIEEGNVLAKSLTLFGGATFAGVIVGAKVPISLVSRADNAYNKKASIALAVIIAHHIKTRSEQ
ncbi:MAG: bifunctional enoyl-CoA hydratase/phosphate acetyltransferase [Candidatus Electryoneaceae bacterium]|nr:bifunctional enoyl-CoA hydratase/phosphate acetyltransferase [Candidatus Electryoneaceae bacterium]